MESVNNNDIVYRLKKRAEIRRAIPTRKSVQAKEPDRIADLLEEAAMEIEALRIAAEHAAGDQLTFKTYESVHMPECLEVGECACQTSGQPHGDGKTCYPQDCDPDCLGEKKACAICGTECSCSEPTFPPVCCSWCDGYKDGPQTGSL